MPVIVQKYGGSSVSDVAGLRLVAERVAHASRSGWQVVVVVSAMGNTTNELIALAQAVSSSPTRRELDLLVSVGERVSMTLLAMAVQELGVEAKSFTGSQSGIITDGEHVSARILEVRPNRIRKALDEGKVAIVAGFQGVSRGKEVTTLGRGGSDATAVALAAALQADFCEICSDVAGVYTADPRIVGAASLIESMTTDSALALSRAGAKVLQESALEFARRAGIRLCATSTSSEIGAGTMIGPESPPVPTTAVSLDRDFRLFWAPSPRFPPPLHRSVRRTWGDRGGISILLDQRNLHGAAVPPEWEDCGETATISVLGEGLEPSLLPLLLSSLQGFGLSRWWMDASRWIGLLPLEHAEDALRAAHGVSVENH
jgi:aspartate kinase